MIVWGDDGREDPPTLWVLAVAMLLAVSVMAGTAWVEEDAAATRPPAQSHAR